MPESRRSKLWIHIIGWMIFITYEIIIAKIWGSSASVLDFGCYYLLDIPLFYLNAEIIVRYSKNFRKIFLKLIPLMLIEILIYCIISIVVGILLYRIQNHWQLYELKKIDFATAIYRAIFIIGFSTGYGFFRQMLSAEKEANRINVLQLQAENEKMEMEKDLFKTRNAHLQTQINRHLLFNTLNFIYSSVSSIDARLGKSVLILSETMHYALKESKHGKVPLSEEIHQIERYILLNEFRWNNRLRLSFTTNVDDQTKELGIPPLLLVTFVENVFKHGDLTSFDEEAKIQISSEYPVIQLYTENHKKGYTHQQSEPHTGIANARTRLEAHYSNRYALDLEEKGDIFIVTLKIKL
jgi:two-component system LytT family sensor kinase